MRVCVCIYIYIYKYMYMYKYHPESKDCLRTNMLLREHKQCFKSLAGKLLSIQHIVQTWPKVIFTCSHHWRNFWVEDASKRWRSERCYQGVFKWTGSRGLWWRHKKVITCYDKGLNVRGDYVEKKLRVCNNNNNNNNGSMGMGEAVPL